MQRTRVLVADDDAEQARTLGKSLVEHGYGCELVHTPAAALAAVSRGACDVVLCDIRMGASRDLELLERLRNIEPQVPVIILTTRGTTQAAVEAVKRGAYQFVVRPCHEEELHRHIGEAVADIEASRLRFSSSPGALPTAELVHESPAMQELMQTIALVALSSAPVLIVGETGTGKELVARAIHERGPRAGKAFVPVNTTAIPEQLLESELFGHVRGAYTGALHARIGLFAEADGGTLLLDEIGDMPKALQPKILRTLQLGEMRAVGSDRPRRVDTRVIAATHRDLDDLIRKGLFRDDLRYRLNTLTLRVPPLRERREDIAPLVQRFLASARARSPSSPVSEISAEAMLILERAPWPGNVRELESAIERLVVLGRESTVTRTQLAFLATVATGAAESVRAAWPRCPDRYLTLRELSQQYIDWMLDESRGDKARAADVLGIDVSTLYRRQRARD